MGAPEEGIPLVGAPALVMDVRAELVGVVEGPGARGDAVVAERGICVCNGEGWRISFEGESAAELCRARRPCISVSLPSSESRDPAGT